MLKDPIESALDIHVHLVADGSSGNGGWLRIAWFTKLLAPIMLKQMGLPRTALHSGLDAVYEKCLAEMLQSSSVGGAVILAHEQVYNEQGQLQPELGTMYVPNDYLFQVCARHEKFLPGVSIHPARPDALDELDRCLELGAVLMKCLPNCQNIDCSDKRYRPFWEKMAKAGLPLLAHTGGELSIQVVTRKYQDPNFLRLPLECGVTVIAAHAGTSSYPMDKDYFPTLASMLQEYPHLYADNSALNTPFRSARLRDCLLEPFVCRMVHGSDVPIGVSGRWAKWRGLLSSEDYVRCEGEKNPIEKDYLLKQAIGFPQKVFSRAWKLLRLPKKYERTESEPS